MSQALQGCRKTRTCGLLRCSVLEDFQEYNVATEEEVEGPVQRHPHFTFHAREFQQINRPPQPPGEESRKSEPPDLGNRRAPPKTRQNPKLLVQEPLLHCAWQARNNVVAGKRSLTDSVLGRRRTRPSGVRVWHRSAVAQRPHARASWHLKI